MSKEKKAVPQPKKAFVLRTIAPTPPKGLTVQKLLDSFVSSARRAMANQANEKGDEIAKEIAKGFKVTLRKDCPNPPLSAPVSKGAALFPVVDRELIVALSALDTDNRPRKNGNLANLRRAMEKGVWRYNGIPYTVLFHPKGEVCVVGDCGHRTQTLLDVFAGHPEGVDLSDFVLLLNFVTESEEIDPSVFSTFDSGAPRTSKDTLIHSGKKDWNGDEYGDGDEQRYYDGLNAGLRILQGRYRNTGVTNNPSGKLQASELSEAMRRFPGLTEIAAQVWSLCGDFTEKVGGNGLPVPAKKTVKHPNCAEGTTVKVTGTDALWGTNKDMSKDRLPYVGTKNAPPLAYIVAIAYELFERNGGDTSNVNASSNDDAWTAVSSFVESMKSLPILKEWKTRFVDVQGDKPGLDARVNFVALVALGYNPAGLSETERAEKDAASGPKDKKGNPVTKVKVPANVAEWRQAIGAAENRIIRLVDSAVRVEFGEAETAKDKATRTAYVA